MQANHVAWNGKALLANALLYSEAAMTLNTVKCKHISVNNSN